MFRGNILPDVFLPLSELNFVSLSLAALSTVSGVILLVCKYKGRSLILYLLFDSCFHLYVCLSEGEEASLISLQPSNPEKSFLSWQKTHHHSGTATQDGQSFFSLSFMKVSRQNFNLSVNRGITELSGFTWCRWTEADCNGESPLCRCLTEQVWCLPESSSTSVTEQRPGLDHVRKSAHKLSEEEECWSSWWW